MTSFSLGIGMALWFGILTSISPCPLATNIAAVSFIGRRVASPAYVLTAGLLYTFGRMITYVVLGIVLLTSAELIPSVANFLQNYMNILVGPVLIVLGIILLDVIPLNLACIDFQGKTSTGLVEKSGIFGAGLLGILFALSFCPISAALFFGSLFSLAIQHDSSVIMPSIYGFGTAIPVISFAFLLAFASHLVGSAFNKISAFERWARKITAVVFILAGIFYVFRYMFHLV